MTSKFVNKDVATLPLLLKQLCLSTMAKHWEEQSVQAESAHWSYGRFLSVLAEMEAAARKQRRIDNYLKKAKLPADKSLSNFNFSEAKSINSAQIEALAQSPDWVHKAKNVLLFGPSGVGKTHLAAAITHRLIEQGVRALFTSTTALVQDLQLARRECRLPETFAKLNRYPLLVLDDIGYVKKSEAETSVLFELIAERYEQNSLLITSNQPFSEWDQIFPDSITAVAAIDRLVHHSTIISIAEQSYRKKMAQDNLTT